MDPFNAFTALTTGTLLGLFILWSVWKIVGRYSIQRVLDSELDRDADSYFKSQASLRLTRAVRDEGIARDALNRAFEMAGFVEARG